MIRFGSLLAVLFIATALLSTGQGLTSRDAVVGMYEKNEKAFLTAAESRDFTALEQIDGVIEISTYQGCVDLWCGGFGLGSATSYYGIFFSEKDDLFAVLISCGSSDQLKPDGAGFRYEQTGGDNRYYVEPLGNHYFYYEAHY